MARIHFELIEYCAEFCVRVRVNARAMMGTQRKRIFNERDESAGYMPSDFMNGVSP